MQPPPIPPWLPDDPAPPGRTAVVEHACALLSKPQATVSLVAAPGTGATTVAGAVAARMAERMPVRALRLAGFSELPDIFHAIGHAMGAAFPRDQAAVCEALREAGPTLLVLDDADGAGIETALERLAAVALEARFFTVGRNPAVERSVIHLSPLLGTESSQLDPSMDSHATLVPGAGNLVLRRLAELDSGPEPWAFLDTLPEAAGLLAAFPAGIPGGRPRGVPSTLLLPSPQGRTIMRRCVAETLLQRRRPDDRDLALALLPRCGRLLQLAEEPRSTSPVDPADLLLLAHLARHHPDPGEASRASAAWSRILVAAGQTSVARVWQDADARTPRGGRYEALLAWAEGDALLADGDLDKAQVAFEFAAVQLRRGGDARLLANLHLHCAGQLQARGASDAAEEQALTAAELFEQISDELGQATAAITQANGRLLAGDPDRADAMLARAEALLITGEREVQLPCALHLVRAALALTRGDLPQAKAELQLALGAQGSEPLQRGTLARLQAEIALREGELSAATGKLEQALGWYGSAGERASVARTLRLLGDVAALAGEPHEADRHYQRATREQVRAGDIRGLARTLEHRGALERELGSVEVADHLDELRSELLSLLPAG
jgi:predicted negative regulator of RcsB-dependent stress response